MPVGRAARGSPCNSSSTTRKAPRTACCTATPPPRPSSRRSWRAQPFAARHMSMESLYEYGSRAGVWRLLRLFRERSMPLTVFGVGDGARAQSGRGRRVHGGRPRNREPRLALDLVPAGRRSRRARAHGARGRDDRASHRARRRKAGTRAATARTRCAWSPSTAASLIRPTATATTCPTTFAVPTRAGVTPLLIVPYALDTNDMRFATPQGFNSGEQFFAYLKDAFDVLYAEGDPKGAERAEDAVGRAALPASLGDRRAPPRSRVSWTTCGGTKTSGSHGASTSRATGSSGFRCRAGLTRAHMELAELNCHGPRRVRRGAGPESSSTRRGSRERVLR